MTVFTPNYPVGVETDRFNGNKASTASKNKRRFEFAVTKDGVSG